MSTSNDLRSATRWAAVGAAVAITLGAAGIGGLNIASADVSSRQPTRLHPDQPVPTRRHPTRRPHRRTADHPNRRRTRPSPSPPTARNGECTGPSDDPHRRRRRSPSTSPPSDRRPTPSSPSGATEHNPGTSNLNPRAGGAPTPNSVNTPLSRRGTFNIFNNHGSTNVIVDVNGYYANHNHDDRVSEESAPSRSSVTGNASPTPCSLTTADSVSLTTSAHATHLRSTCPPAGAADAVRINWRTTTDFTISGRVLAVSERDLGDVRGWTP